MKIILATNLQFNPNNQTLLIDGKSVRLTTKESELFQELAKNVNNTSLREDVLKAVWGTDDYYASRSMDVYISRLRARLKTIKNVSIMNVHGKGHKLLIESDGLL